MQLSVMVLVFVCLCAVVAGIAAPAFQEEDVRGAFLTSRPKQKPVSSGTATKPSKRRPKQTTSPTNTGKPPEKQTGKPGTSGPSGSSEPSKPVNLPRLGIGLTLFMRDSNGLAQRIDPDHVFVKGDRVRVLLETNADGYLYIFNTTNQGPATMIYPHAELDEGGNYLQAHVPFEVPSSLANEEHLRWFAFDEVAGTEQLFFVFSREPLKGVPLEDELLAFCRNSKESCPIRPSAELWAALQENMQEPLKRHKSQSYGTAETKAEQQATTRGLGLSKDDPQPSLVMMASTPRSMLVTALDLIHQ
jgi:Domain of unknown function (DUF4384)